MFFEIWAEEFINKMEEEKKKRRAKEKERIGKRKEREANIRVAKETVKIVPLWVNYFSNYKDLAISLKLIKYYAKFTINRLLIKYSIAKTSG